MSASDDTEAVNGEKGVAPGPPEAEPTAPKRSRNQSKGSKAKVPAKATGAEPDPAVRAVEEALQKLLERVEAGAVDFGDVVRLTYWQAGFGTPAQQAIGLEHADTAREKFKEANGGDDTRLAVFGNSGTGVYLTPDGVFKWLIARSAIVYDFTDAHRLVYEIDAVAEQAREWWVTSGSEPQERAARPHLDRAYTLITGVLATINEENVRQRDLLVASTDLAEQETSERYANNLRVAEGELRKAERLLEAAGQRSAQARYGLGMIWGTAALTVLCALAGFVFMSYDVEAFNGVALAAGGIGAIVSVLQRMTSGRLRLDPNAGRNTLMTYGAVRPMIGGAFGMVAFVLVAGGLLPAITVSTTAPLAFYAGLGFLAGFNERFAQDMLAGASMQASPSGSASS